MHSFIYVHEYCIYTREMAHSTQCEKAKMFGRGPGAHLVIDGHFSCAYKTHFFSCLFLPASIWFRLYNSSEGGANRHKCDAAECSFGWRKTWRSQSGHKQSVFWAKHEAWIIIRNRVHHGFQFSCLYCLPFHKSQIAHIFEMSQRRHKAQAHKKKIKYCAAFIMLAVIADVALDACTNTNAKYQLFTILKLGWESRASSAWRQKMCFVH